MALSRREVWSLTFVACALLIAFTLIWLAAPARAQERSYTADDTLAAIWQYSIEFDISYTWLRSIVRCETGGDYNPYARAASCCASTRGATTIPTTRTRPSGS
jgi:hypothetical protein